MAEDKLQFDEELAFWAKKTATRLVNVIYDLGIDHTGALAKSIQQQVSKTGDSVDKIIFKYLTYGRYRDMGTGKGFARGGKGTANFAKFRNPNGSLKVVNRKPAHWYSKTMYARIKFMQDKLLVDMNDQIMDTLQARLRRINTHSSNINP
jgi:hypothetical protein